MERLWRSVIVILLAVTAFCEASRASDSHGFKALQQEQTAALNAVTAANIQNAEAQTEQLKAISARLNAETDRANAQSEELKTLKAELARIQKTDALKTHLIYELESPAVRRKISSWSGTNKP